ncbi:MAG: UbiA family prenyltransferase [Acidobacteriota bacterium]
MRDQPRAASTGGAGSALRKNGKGPLATTLVEFSRPFTLLPPTLGVISGAVTAFGSAYNPDLARELSWHVLGTVLAGSLFAALLNAASNGLNQICDLEIDRWNKPARPLPSGRLSLRQAWSFTIALYVLALLPTWFVLPYPHLGWSAIRDAPLAAHECFFIFVLGAVCTCVYSAPACGRTKRFGLWANLTIALPRGLLLKVAGWSMVASALHLEPWYIGVIFLLFLLGASTTKDFSDMHGDRRGGCRTLPIRYGVRRAAQITAPFLVLPWGLLPLGTRLTNVWEGGRPLLTGNPLILDALGAILVVWGVYVARLILRRPEDLAHKENHPSWAHMYWMMMVAQTGFALAYLF